MDCQRDTEARSPLQTQLFSLQGHTALVTGAGSGLGKYMAHALLHAGANLILVGRTLDRLEASAEEIKIKIASAYPMDPEQQIEVKGRDLVTGIPQNIIITSEEVRKAISEQVESIVQAVRIALEQTPPELAADIVDRGIVLTGGGALLKGLDQLLREQTSLPITVVDDPLSTVVMGTGRALDNIHVLKDVCID